MIGVAGGAVINFVGDAAFESNAILPRILGCEPRAGWRGRERQILCASRSRNLLEHSQKSITTIDNNKAIA